MWQMVYCYVSSSLFQIQRSRVNQINQLTTPEFRALLDRYAVEHTLTAKYSSLSKGSERLNKISCLGHPCWWISGAIQSIFYRSTGYSPHFLVFCQNTITNASEHRMLRRKITLNNQARHYNAKFSPKCVPCQIDEKAGYYRYEIDDEDRKQL